MRRWSISLFAAIFTLNVVPFPAIAGEQDEWGEDYATGQKLYNQGRLTEAFDNFERSIKQKKNSKEAEAYLIHIREEITARAKKGKEEREALNYNSNSPESALTVAYLEKGHIQITLYAKYLFDENTASLKGSAMDVIDRLVNLLQSKEGYRIELTVVDELDHTPSVENIDAERSLAIFALLHFRRIAGTNVG